MSITFFQSTRLFKMASNILEKKSERYLVRRGIEDLMTIRLGALAEKTSLRSIGQSRARSLDSTYHRGEELVM